MAVSHVGFMFTAEGTYPVISLVFSWPLDKVGRQTKRAVATAMMNSIGTFWVMGHPWHKAVPSGDGTKVLSGAQPRYRLPVSECLLGGNPLVGTQESQYAKGERSGELQVAGPFRK